VPFDRLQDPEAIANWPETQGRDGARTPIPWTADADHAGFSPVEPWLPVDPRHISLAVDRQEADPDSVLAITRRLVALRKAHPALRAGAIRRIDAPQPILAFERGDGADRLLCVFNLGAESVDWPLPPGWQVIDQVGTPLAPYSGLVAARA
jgi:alpha-glucosidase